MNGKKEIVKVAKRAFELRFGRIYEKDIVLLESYFDGSKVDYVLFRNRFNNRYFRVEYCAHCGRYQIEETDG